MSNAQMNSYIPIDISNFENNEPCGRGTRWQGTQWKNACHSSFTYRCFHIRKSQGSKLQESFQLSHSFIQTRMQATGEHNDMDECEVIDTGRETSTWK